MRFIRSRFGIVLWCAIALIIAIVPLWRLRATRQFKVASVQAALMPDYNSSPISIAGQPEPTRAPIPYGFSDADETEARRRFPDEPVAQLARMNTGELWREVNAITGPISLGSNGHKDQLAQQKARLGQLNPRIWKLTDAYFARYEDLLRRFPDSKLVRAQYLRDVMSVTNIADEGPLSKIDEERTAIEEPALQRLYSPASPATLDRAIEVARASANLIPDNAYFRWAEAIFQFAQKRPDAALNALEAAGRCAEFDDYTYQGIRERVELLQRLRAIGWEDEFTEWMGFLFPHYAKMRSATRAATGQMRLARQRGDEKTALRWSAATARASYPVVRNERNSVIGKLVGQALCSIVWRATIEDEPNVPQYKQVPGDTQEQYVARSALYQKRNAERFAQFARARGDEALARQTLTVLPALDAGTVATYATQSSPLYFNRLSDFYWLGAQLLRLSLVGALVWILSFFVTRKRASKVAATRAKMLLPAMFCAGVTGAILVAALTVAPQIHAVFEALSGVPADEKPSLLVSALRNWWWLVGVLWLCVILGSAMRADLGARPNVENSERANKPDWLVIGRAILIVGFICGGIGAVIAVETSVPIDSVLGRIFPILMMMWLGCAFVGSVSMLVCTRGQVRLLAFCSILAFWMGMIVLPTPNYEGEDLFYKSIATGIVVVAALISVFLALRIWAFGSPLPRFEDFAFNFAARIRIAAGALALLCAVAYFGITLWTIPVEAKTRAMMGRQLQIGEVAWVREQMAAKN